MYISDLTNHFSSTSVDIHNQKLVLGGFSEHLNSVAESIVQSFAEWKDMQDYSGELEVNVFISGNENSFAITSVSTLTSESISYISSPKK